jgi:hypothetical protein
VHPRARWERVQSTCFKSAHPGECRDPDRMAKRSKEDGASNLVLSA